MNRDDSPDDAIREEFLAEANEIVESLSRDLLVLDQGGSERPHELIQEVFRGVHTLKGMAGMFGYTQLGGVAHDLESLLDDLRVGRVDLSREVLDVLFAGVETFQKLLAKQDVDTDDDVHKLAASIGKVGSESRQPRDPLKVYALDRATLDVLTEYEEHRLRTNILEDVPLYRYEVSYPLASIDVELEALKKRARTAGEIITYLPSVGAGGTESIDLEILLASRVPLARLVAEITEGNGTLTAVPRAAPPPRSDRAPEQVGTLPPVEVKESSSAGHATAVELSAAEGAGEALAVRAGVHSVRVDIRKLDALMNMVSELALARASVERVGDRMRARPELRAIAHELARADRALARHITALQDGLLGVRMVPLKQLFERVQRGVRQVARDHDKDVRVVVAGAETELDKVIVEELSDPLMHIVRNSVDHGIESPRERAQVGKPTQGTLAINAYAKGTHVVIEVEDDGRGIDVEGLARAALTSGHLSTEDLEAMSRPDRMGLIFVPGLSTASRVTDTSGRGVGMDVVKHNLAKLGGTVEVQSEAGTGTKFTLTLPITLAIIRVLVVASGRRLFTVPLTTVREAFVFDPRVVHRIDGRDVVSLRGQSLALVHLDGLFGLPRAGTPARKYVVVVTAGARTLGMVVDSLLDQQDVVMKALGPSLAAVRGFAGAAELGGGEVSLVLDVPSLVEEVLAGSHLTPTEALP